MIQRLAEVVPDIEQHILWREAATPLTHHRYTRSTGGTPYGLELSIRQFAPFRPGVRTEIGGLHLCGASMAWGPAVEGAMLSGLHAAGAALGRDLDKEIRRGAVLGLRLPDDPPGEWDPFEAAQHVAGKRRRASRPPRHGPWSVRRDDERLCRGVRRRRAARHRRCALRALCRGRPARVCGRSQCREARTAGRDHLRRSQCDRGRRRRDPAAGRTGSVRAHCSGWTRPGTGGVQCLGAERADALLSTTPEFVEQMWRVCCFGGFLVGQEAIRHMLPQRRGTLLFTGASASLRGKPMFGAFAAAKAGLRAHAQAMAREFGPKGIHVAHVVVDGVVAGERAKAFGHGLGKAYLYSKGEDGGLKPDAIAEAYWQLHVQHRSAWTQELDLRPYKEKF